MLQQRGILELRYGRYDPLFLSWFLFSNVIEYQILFFD
jgi:hypothetical protein